jgi:hypothetical protein
MPFLVSVAETVYVVEPFSSGVKTAEAGASTTLFACICKRQILFSCGTMTRAWTRYLCLLCPLLSWRVAREKKHETVMNERWGGLWTACRQRERSSEVPRCGTHLSGESTAVHGDARVNKDPKSVMSPPNSSVLCGFLLIVRVFVILPLR